jgi:hypothetical protein
MGEMMNEPEGCLSIAASRVTRLGEFSPTGHFQKEVTNNIYQIALKYI